MKSMICKKTLISVVLIISVALALIIYMSKNGYTSFVMLIVALAFISVRNIVDNGMGGEKKKKIIITKKKIVITVCLVIVAYFLLFNVFDLRLVKSLKNM